MNEIEKCFTNTSLIDSNKFLNDTAFRNTFLACYSTTLGSLLHEFSHTLDIGHNADGKSNKFQNISTCVKLVLNIGIMHRGFDDLYCFFTVTFEKCICYKNRVVS